jgi:photosystem II stability/assembly factor-like uncharacterized protein
MQQSNQSGGGVQKLLSVIAQLLPILIIGGLLYAGFFVKAEAVITKVEPKPIERRDNFFSIISPSDQIAWAAGTGGKIVRTDDGGKTWVRQPTPTLNNLQGIAAWDAQTAVAAGNFGLILHTTDGGANWKVANTPKSENPNKLFRVRVFGDTAWAVGEFTGLFRSDDKGANWTRVLPEDDRAFNSIYFVGQNGWIVGELGSILRTEDGGANWIPVETENKVSLMGVTFRDAQHGVAVGLTGTLLVTNDGGLSWTEVPDLTREHLLDVVWDENRWLAVGDKGVMATSDAEASAWKVSRLSEGDVAWRTSIVKVGSRYFVAGANLGILEDGKLTVVGR